MTGWSPQGSGMRAALGVWAVALGLLAGCHTAARVPPPPRQPVPTIGPVTVELPPTRATRREPDLRSLPKTAVRQVSASEDAPYRMLTEPVCQMLAAKHSALANALDDEGRVPTKCETPAD